MSKVKTPREKKDLSLSKDRRNLYGECPTSSRKNIRRGKQRIRRELRRGASQELLGLKGSAETLRAEEAEAQAKSKILAAKLASFKKQPDTPLGEAIEWKSNWRSRRSNSR